MAAVSGRKGSIAITGVATDLNSAGAHALLASKWSGSIDQDTHDITPFSPTSGAKKNLGGLHSMTGTIEGFLDDTAPHVLTHMTEATPTVLGFTLTATTSITYAFNGILSNWSPNIDVQGVNTWSASFVSDGPITIA